MTLKLREVGAEESGVWDSFLDTQPDSTFFHRHAWSDIIREAFGHQPHYLAAEREGKIEGVLPLVHVKSLLFGSTLSSLPFCVYGGEVAATKEARDLLRRSACDLAKDLAVDSLELRNISPSPYGWPVKDLYATFRKPIEPDVESNMKAIPKRQRAMVRKGINAGLVSEASDDSDRLYRVYAESVRNLGTPVFSKRYFRILKDVFGTDCRILMIQHAGRDVAGVMSFYFRGQVLPYYGGSLSVARDIKGCNDFMYWELMRISCEEGYRSFDFGRSKQGTGPYKFKKNWGFSPEPLHYEYFLVKADAIPEVNPLNPRYRLLVNTWQRLPLPIANLLGPKVARSLG